MKFLSLFAGIGGFDLGLERAGMTCAAQIEIDDFCQRVLTKHWPDVPKFRDVRDFGRNSIDGTVDLICGGFPCQPFSVAGKREGERDDRHLWPEYLRIIKQFRPRWVLGENVAGIINMALDQVLSDLESEGYACRAFVIPACAVNAPHRRDRVWIVGNAEQSGRARQSRRGAVAQLTHGHLAISEIDPNTKSARLERWQRRRKQRFLAPDVFCAFDNGYIDNHKLPKPAICRGDDGFSGRVDRLKALGNAVVPQVVEVLGRAIMHADSA